MVNIPKTRRTYCPKCRKHEKFKVTQYKKTPESDHAQGRRRYRSRCITTYAVSNITVLFEFTS